MLDERQAREVTSFARHLILNLPLLLRLCMVLAAVVAAVVVEAAVGVVAASCSSTQR